MSLRHALLGLLAERPMSGYDLAELFSTSIANVWSAKHSQIYPELGRLESSGLIEVVEEGPRGRKAYATTAAGRDEVRAWLLGTEPDRTVRNEPLLRAFLLWLLDPADAAALLRAEEEAHAARLTGFEQRAEHWSPASPPQRAGRIVLEAGLRSQRALLGWARWAREQYEAQTDRTGAQSVPSPTQGQSPRR